MWRSETYFSIHLPVLMAIGYPVWIQVLSVGWSFKSVRFRVKEFEVGQISIKGGHLGIICGASALGNAPCAKASSVPTGAAVEL